MSASELQNQGKDTKQRIIDRARELFAERGFEGTSIRDLAKLADVNVAAINYHFGNKTGLYTETIRQCYLQTCHDMEDLYQKKEWSFLEFVGTLFDHMYQDPNMVKNFQIVLQDNLISDIEFQVEDEEIGPPGSAVLMKCLEREIGHNLSKEDKLWAVRTIFTHIGHLSLISQTSFGKRESLAKYFEADYVKKNTIRLAKLVDKELNEIADRTKREE